MYRVIDIMSIAIYVHADHNRADSGNFGHWEVCEGIMKSDIVLKPVGEVVSDIRQALDMPITGKIAVIKIYPEFVLFR